MIPPTAGRPFHERLGPALAIGAGLLAALALGLRYDFILEDTFISLRYARHLRQGFGPVYNPGEEPVEGYTNFLWMLLGAAHFFFTAQPERWFLLYNRLLGLGLVLAVGRELIARRLGRWVWLGVGLVALDPDTPAWMAGGLETHLFALLVLVGLGRNLREEYEPASAARPWSAAILALALLTRPEGYLLAGVAAGAMIARRLGPGTRAPGGWGRLVLGWGVVAGVGATHLIGRRLYYGAWVPNTFVAKVPGPYFEKGLPYVGLFYAYRHGHWGVTAALALATLGLAAWRPRRPAAPQMAILTIAIGLMTFYQAYVGGDAFQFRLFMPVVPLMAILIPMALAGLESLAEELPPPRRRWARPGLWALGAALLLRPLHATLGLADYDPLRRLNSYPAQDYQDWNWTERLRPMGLWLRAFARPGEPIAVTAAGVIPYLSDLPTVDMHGLNDRRIARRPIERRGMVGHERLAAFEDLTERGVVYVLDDIVTRASPARWPEALRADPASIFAQLFDGRWMRFRTTRDPAALRRDLRARSAIIAAGPDEPQAAIRTINLGNRSVFESRAAALMGPP